MLSYRALNFRATLLAVGSAPLSIEPLESPCRHPHPQRRPGCEELLRGLLLQKMGFDYEVLVLDSGSTHGTAELAGRHGTRVHQEHDARDREICLEQER